MPAQVDSPYPRIRDLADIAAIETVPLAQRLNARSTYELIQRGALDDPARAALIALHEDIDAAPTVLSFAQVACRVTQAANLLHALGVRAGDAVALVLPNLPQTHLALWGAEAAGIASPMNPLLETGHLAGLLNAARSRVLVIAGPEVDPDTWARLPRLRALVPSLRAVLRVGGAAGDLDGTTSFDAALDAFPADRLVSARRIAPDDVAAYFHTGGTTGVPKLARHTHRGQIYQAWALAMHCDIRPGDRVVSGLPLFHNAGVINLGLAPLSVGAGVVLLGPAGFRNHEVVRNFWRIVERHRATFFIAVPTVYTALLEHPVSGDVSSLRYGLSGAAPAPPTVIAETERRTGIRILEGYGITEATCGAAVNPKDGPSRLGSIGLRLAYEQVRVARIDAQGRDDGDCAAGEVGTLLLKGPHVFAGYVMPEHDQGAFVGDGWLNTGDLARQDEQGYLWLVGRAKDLIIRGGHNIDPAMIESALARHPAVALAAAVGRPDGYAGELPVAYVTLRPGLRASADALLAWARAHIGERAAVPVAIEVLDALPLTAVGKIAKLPLRRAAARSAVEQLMQPLCPEGATLRVEIIDEPSTGSLARIAFTGIAGAHAPALRQRAAAAMGTLALRCTIDVSR